MADGPLEGALDELYAADPSEFVAVRKRLAAALSTTGDKGSAKDLRGARRPSTSAWALNQLARSDPKLIAVLLERSADLVAAQTRALSGRPEAMRVAMHAHREALAATTDAALEILGSRANDAFRSEIISTLRAASSDDDVGRRLARGRLLREESSPGFPDATGLTLVPQPERSPASAKAKAKSAREPAPRPDRADDVERAAAAQREREREEQRQADLAAKEAAARVAAAADRDATDARTRIEALQRELEIARHDLSSALDRSRAAKKEAAKRTPAPDRDRP
jgi:hypothetical protein